MPAKILIIQTAFLGDVILATSVIEKLHAHFPEAKIDFLLRAGNETVLEGHPYLRQLLIWNKKKPRWRELWQLLRQIRQQRYDLVINLQRYFSSGLLTALSGAKATTGFHKNPWSFLFTHAAKHQYSRDKSFIHEIDRNNQLIAYITDDVVYKPKIYLSENQFKKIKVPGRYITISPASVWFTKQYPPNKWAEFIDRVGEDITVYLLGGKSDIGICETINQLSQRSEIITKAGELSLQESAALMRGAIMNYTNDSAPLHLASAVDAPVTAIFCSTVPDFGFTPLSPQSYIAETKEQLNCRPCGIHGKKACPKGHFRCANIDSAQLLANLPR